MPSSSEHRNTVLVASLPRTTHPCRPLRCHGTCWRPPPAEMSPPRRRLAAASPPPRRRLVFSSLVLSQRARYDDTTNDVRMTPSHARSRGRGRGVGVGQTVGRRSSGRGDVRGVGLARARGWGVAVAGLVMSLARAIARHVRDVRRRPAGGGRLARRMRNLGQNGYLGRHHAAKSGERRRLVCDSTSHKGQRGAENAVSPVFLQPRNRAMSDADRAFFRCFVI